jgi:hypothetical protein
MAGDLEFTCFSKREGSFANRAGQSFEPVIRANEAQQVNGIRAGNSEMDRNARWDDDAVGHENILLRNHAHGE